jgi:hypothetical protein
MNAQVVSLASGRRGANNVARRRTVRPDPGPPGVSGEASYEWVVGRDEELGALAELLDPGCGGSPVVLVGGPGIGKPTLWEAALASLVSGACGCWRPDKPAVSVECCVGLVFHAFLRNLRVQESGV